MKLLSCSSDVKYGVNNEKGMYLVLLIPILFAILIVFFLSVEGMNLYVGKQRLQRAVDVAALAGAKLIYRGESSTAIQAAARDLLVLNLEEIGLSATDLEPGTPIINVDDVAGTVSVSTKLRVRHLLFRNLSSTFGLAQETWIPSSGSARANSLNLVLTLDLSGSMGSSTTAIDPSKYDERTLVFTGTPPQRIEKLREALGTFVASIRGSHHYISVVGTNTVASVLVPPVKSDLLGRLQVTQAAANAVARGATNIQMGLELARKQLQDSPNYAWGYPVNVLFTDGNPNLALFRISAAAAKSALPPNTPAENRGGHGLYLGLGQYNVVLAPFDVTRNGNRLKGILYLMANALFTADGLGGPFQTVLGCGTPTRTIVLNNDLPEIPFPPCMALFNGHLGAIGGILVELADFNGSPTYPGMPVGWPTDRLYKWPVKEHAVDNTALCNTCIRDYKFHRDPSTVVGLDVSPVPVDSNDARRAAILSSFAEADLTRGRGPLHVVALGAPAPKTPGSAFQLPAVMTDEHLFAEFYCRRLANDPSRHKNPADPDFPFPSEPITKNPGICAHTEDANKLAEVSAIVSADIQKPILFE